MHGDHKYAVSGDFYIGFNNSWPGATHTRILAYAASWRELPLYDTTANTAHAVREQHASRPAAVKNALRVYIHVLPSFTRCMFQTKNRNLSNSVYFGPQTKKARPLEVVPNSPPQPSFHTLFLVTTPLDSAAS